MIINNTMLLSDKIYVDQKLTFCKNVNMLNAPKCLYKTSYRIDSHIKHIMDNTFAIVRKRAGYKLSNGTIARTFWLVLYENDGLRKRCLDTVCGWLIKDVCEKGGDKNHSKHASKHKV